MLRGGAASSRLLPSRLMGTSRGFRPTFRPFRRPPLLQGCDDRGPTGCAEFPLWLGGRVGKELDLIEFK